jgi:hypothetical protein
MRKVLFIRNLEELNLARRLFEDKINDIEIYTLYSQEFLNLIDEGGKINIFSQHISADEAYSIYSQSFEEISKVVDAFPQVKGPHPVNLSRFFKVTFWEFLTEVYALDMVLKRILDTGTKSLLIYFNYPYPRLISQVDLTNPYLISSEMFESLSLHGPFVVQSLGDNKFNHMIRRLSNISFHKNLIRYLKDLIIFSLYEFGPQKATEEFKGADKRRIIAFGSGYDALIVIPDAIQLALERDCSALWMTEGIDTNTTRSGLIYREEYGKVDRFSINNYLKQSPIPPLTLKEIYQIHRLFEELLDLLNKIEVIRRYGLVKLIRRLRNLFRQSLWHTKVIDRVLSRFPSSTIVVTDYNGMRERAIEQLSPSYQIEVVARPHGWMSNLEGFDYRADHYLVSGQLWRDVVETFYGKDTPIRISPDPSLIRVANEWLCKTESEQQVIINQKRNQLSIKAPVVVLFMTTSARMHILNEFDYNALYRLWKCVFDYLKEHPDIHLVVKSHKNNYDKWVRAQALRNGVDNLTILPGRLEDAVILADLIVDLGKPGSATLVALFFGKPTLLYRGLYKYVRQLGDLTHASGASFLVQTPDDLCKEIEYFRNFDTAHRNDLKSRNCTLRMVLSAD